MPCRSDLSRANGLRGPTLPCGPSSCLGGGPKSLLVIFVIALGLGAAVAPRVETGYAIELQDGAGNEGRAYPAGVVVAEVPENGEGESRYAQMTTHLRSCFAWSSTASE